MSRYALLAGLIYSLCLTGCPLVISLDYQPSNPLKGIGTVAVTPFVYRPALEHLVRPREVQTAEASIGAIFLSSEIGGIYTDALKRELTHSGYAVAPAGERIISGVIERFLLDETDAAGTTFVLLVSSTITAQGQTLHTHTCRSSQTQGILPLMMKTAMRDCIERFLREAQDAKAL